MTASQDNIDAGYVYFHDQLARARAGHERLYSAPVDMITAYQPDEVMPALAKMETARRSGFHLAGYFAYELGYVLEPALQPLLPKGRTEPLLCFGVFEDFARAAPPQNSPGYLGAARPALSAAGYGKKFDRVQDYIRRGDVYQVNLTMPVTGAYHGSPADIYALLKVRQPVRYGGIIALGDMQIVTLSPELFFKKDGAQILMKPMKGTAARGQNPADDEARARGLGLDVKNRAENLMIVDLLRNDLSRIAKPGSVKVNDLFAVESYPSLHTMTSGVNGALQDGADLQALLTALFPCGSVTGAPKIRAMEIIRELETTPRGVYCGAIGWIAPNGDMEFNVAIRTLSLGHDGRFTYGTGGGVVYDSRAQSEYDECLLKAQYLNAPDFQLIETMGWHEQTGFMHVDLHQARLAKSAKALGFPFNPEHFTAALAQAVAGKTGPQRVRLTMSRTGAFQAAARCFTPQPPDTVWPLAISKNPLDSRDPWLAHKTTRRGFYETELARLKAQTQCREAIFLNENGALCEGSFSNIFIEKNGQMMTPRLSAGLLPGILRQVLVSSGQAIEADLELADLRNADRIWVGNSLRGLISARLLSETPA